MNNEKIQSEIIDQAVNIAAFGVAEKAYKEGSTQISNLLSMIQSDQTEIGIKKLLLYISRQSGRRIINRQAAGVLIKDIQAISQEDNAPQLVIDYITYTKWAFESIVQLDSSDRRGIRSLKDLLKKVK